MNADHHHEWIPRRITPMVDIHCSTNMKYANSAMTAGAVNSRFLRSSVMVDNSSNGSLEFVATTIWPSVDTNTSQAAKELGNATSVRQLKPSRLNTGSMTLPISAA